ncbi:phage tail protein, partial [Clostridium cagae]|uniref:phage tail protein n=1 Tax=Clostridium cagae TaxID=2080751 RepID=UPI003F777D86
MQEENFGSILTNIGKAKVANATLLNGNIALKMLKIGDSNGTYYNPTEDQVELRNTVYECAVGAIKIDTNNPNWITVETLLSGNIGGFTIREVGLFDADGDMIVVGKYPETYKPLIENGASKDINVRIIFEVSNTENVTLNTNPSVIIATKEDINNLQEQIENNDSQMKDIANNKASKTELEDLKNTVANIDLSATKVNLATINGMSAKNVQSGIQELFTFASNG